MKFERKKYRSKKNERKKKNSQNETNGWNEIETFHWNLSKKILNESRFIMN